MRMFSIALLIGTVAQFALIASQASAQYLGKPYYGQPPPYYVPRENPSRRETPYYGTRETQHHGTTRRVHHHGKPTARHHAKPTEPY